jgi:hypothetical protein
MRSGLFLLLGFLVFSHISKAQSVSYYPFASQLAISSNPTQAAWAEMRVQMNSATSALTTEFGPMLTVKKTKTTAFYIGGGANIGWMSNVINNTSMLKGYYGSAGFRSYPFEKLPQVGLNFEFTPYTDSKVQTGLLRAWLGLSYHFGKNNLKN